MKITSELAVRTSVEYDCGCVKMYAITQVNCVTDIVRIEDISCAKGQTFCDKPASECCLVSKSDWADVMAKAINAARNLREMYDTAMGMASVVTRDRVEAYLYYMQDMDGLKDWYLDGLAVVKQGNSVGVSHAN